MSHVTNVSDDEVLELKRAFRQHDREGTGDVKIKQMRGFLFFLFLWFFSLLIPSREHRRQQASTKTRALCPPSFSAQNMDYFLVIFRIALILLPNQRNTSRSQRRWCQDSTNAHFIFLSIFFSPQLFLAFILHDRERATSKFNGQAVSTSHLLFLHIIFLCNFPPYWHVCQKCQDWVEAQCFSPQLLFLLRFWSPK